MKDGIIFGIVFTLIIATVVCAICGATGTAFFFGFVLFLILL